MLPDMNSLVFLPVTAIAESLGAERAGERFFSRVEPHVRLDVAGLRELLAAEFTARLVLLVRGDVLHGVFSVRFCHQIRIRHCAYSLDLSLSLSPVKQNRKF